MWHVPHPLARTGFSAMPDLIISDRRLRDDENGIAMVERLRTKFNNDIPAILITGYSKNRLEYAA